MHMVPKWRRCKSHHHQIQCRIINLDPDLETKQNKTKLSKIFFRQLREFAITSQNFWHNKKYTILLNVSFSVSLHYGKTTVTDALVQRQRWMSPPSGQTRCQCCLRFLDRCFLNLCRLIQLSKFLIKKPHKTNIPDKHAYPRLQKDSLLDFAFLNFYLGVEPSLVSLEFPSGSNHRHPFF